MSKTQAAKHFAVVLIPFLTFLLGWNIGTNQESYASPQNSKKTVSLIPESFSRYPDAEGDIDLNLFWEVLGILEAKYVDGDAFDEPQEKRELLYGAIAGMVAALDDPYTAFMDPKENKDFQESLIGQLEGIGAELTLRDEILTVVTPLKDSPASKAGIRPEDIILKINDEDATGMSLEEAVSKIRGPRGTKVNLTVFHQGDEEPTDVEITRNVVHIDSVTWEMTRDNIALLTINQFGEYTLQEFQKSVTEILATQPDGLIVDLRFNSGGYLDSAVKISSEFFKDELVAVSIKKRSEEDQEIYRMEGNGRLTDIPMVVIINKGSASASEILAGALQDYERAHIIGEQSFGKGTVQELEPLSNGASIRVTIAKWYTPDNNSIAEKGITPDQEVEMTVEDYKEDRDPQLDAAIEYLLNN